jgi:hypothetical protein
MKYRMVFHEIPSEVEGLQYLNLITGCDMECCKNPCQRWIAPSHREKPEESKRANQREQ